MAFDAEWDDTYSFNFSTIPGQYINATVGDDSDDSIFNIINS